MLRGYYLLKTIKRRFVSRPKSGSGCEIPMLDLPDPGQKSVIVEVVSNGDGVEEIILEGGVENALPIAQED